MNLARMMTDKFFIEDRDGKRSGPFKTKFGSGTIMVFQDALPVADGNRIIRPLADGSERVYVVQSHAFNSGSRNIPSHFSIQIAEHATCDASVQDGAVPPAPVADMTPDSLAAAMQSLAQAIDRSNFPAEQKDAARATLRSLLESPVVTAVLAAAQTA